MIFDIYESAKLVAKKGPRICIPRMCWLPRTCMVDLFNLTAHLQQRHTALALDSDGALTFAANLRGAQRFGCRDSVPGFHQSGQLNKLQRDGLYSLCPCEPSVYWDVALTSTTHAAPQRESHCDMEAPADRACYTRCAIGVFAAASELSSGRAIASHESVNGFASGTLSKSKQDALLPRRVVSRDES